MKSFYKFTKPLIIAHRGASGTAPENTLAAFRKAVDLHADGVEFDVKLSSDHQVVVMHDQTVDRTTNGSGLVSQLSYQEISRLDAGAKFSADFSGEKVPLLQDVMELLNDKLLMNIELTNYSTNFDPLPRRVAKIVSEYHLEKEVLVSSFNPFNLVRYHQFSPQTGLALLIEPGVRSAIFSWIFREIFSIRFLHPHISQLNQESMRHYKKRFSRINTWTVNEIDEMKFALKLGVDGIITDYPEKVNTLLEDDRLSV